ncbi:hypothetical protein F5146DRAFT_1222841 [Armillaria mellea]|nr:hypothetical protein F5146DRAFT_1222841 [Armillaria mellea]
MSAPSKATTTTTATATSNKVTTNDGGDTSSVSSAPRDGTSKPSQQQRRDRPLTDIIGQTFPSFDHQSIVVKPFGEESARDVAFSQAQCYWMWSSKRMPGHRHVPNYESQAAAQKFEKKISQVMEVEKEQGTSPFSLSSIPSVIFEQTRERLNEFVSRMKTALAALTGLGL